jgi:hemolysin activation/secretion protein
MELSNITGILMTCKNCLFVAAATVLVIWPGWLVVVCQAVSDSAGEPERSSAPGRSAAETGGLENVGNESRFFIREYKVHGAKRLPRNEVERAVYPYLGPYRTSEDIQKACSSLEKAYQARGYQTVAVQAQPRPDRKGVVMLRVAEIEVGRLRVRDSRYFDLERIKEDVPSLAEGSLPNFEDVNRDIVGLNRLPDRRITPAINAGKEPGKVDVDLMVKDAFPLHGSIELNNRYSADTTSLRLNSALSYGNLWQMGHTIGLSYQMSPLELNQVKSLSAYYLAPVPDINGLNLMLQGSKQNSNVSTLGAVNSLGGGESLGVRAMMSLPARKGFYHSATGGFDYKYSSQDITLGQNTAEAIRTPVTYFPWSANYNASWLGEGSATDFNGGVTFNVRGLGSDTPRFNARRHSADANFIYFRGDLSHTRDLPWGSQFFVKAQGQAADRPLISNEQFSGGGMDTARGYLESLYMGDNAIFGTMELRSPTFGGYLWKEIKEWRAFSFVDAGRLALKNPLPAEVSHFDLASWGFGSRIRIEDHFNGAVTLGIPMVFSSQFKGPVNLLTFRLWYEF